MPIKRVSQDQSRFPTLICGIQKLECWKREKHRAERRGDRSDFVTSLRQQNSAIRCTVRMTAYAVWRCVEAEADCDHFWRPNSVVPIRTDIKRVSRLDEEMGQLPCCPFADQAMISSSMASVSSVRDRLNDSK